MEATTTRAHMLIRYFCVEASAARSSESGRSCPSAVPALPAPATAAVFGPAAFTAVPAANVPRLPRLFFRVVFGYGFDRADLYFHKAIFDFGFAILDFRFAPESKI